MGGDAHIAQGVTQPVFADLARKAAALARHRVPAGWLFTSARYTAAKLVRGERRRRVRETEAELLREILHEDGGDGGAEGGLDRERVRPVLDEALAELGEAEREAVLLRFFERRDYAAVGARCGLGENAARMRVGRAVDKLRAALDRRRVTSTSAALAVAIGGQAVTAAPAGLAASAAGVTGLVSWAQNTAKLHDEIAGSRLENQTMGVERATVDRQPRPTFHAQPEHPAALRSAPVTGKVVVEFVVDGSGEVRDARAVKSKLEGAVEAKGAGEREARGSRESDADGGVRGGGAGRDVGQRRECGGGWPAAGGGGGRGGGQVEACRPANRNWRMVRRDGSSGTVARDGARFPRRNIASKLAPYGRIAETGRRAVPRSER